MKKLHYLAYTLLFLVGCKNQSPSDVPETQPQVTTETSSAKTVTEALELGCYTFNETDKIRMEITEIGDSIKGTLDIAYEGKDANNGHFSGILKEDKLIATYSFRSEGILSKRQIVYAIEKNTLLMGYGTMNDQGTSFSDIHNLKFDRTKPLKKTDCSK